MPHCADCLVGVLGRRYCPACAEQVRALAGIRPPGAPAAAADPRSPRWPGWLSGLAFTVALYGTLLMGGSGLGVALTLARAALGKPQQPRLEPLDPSGLGLGLWVGVFGSWAWAMLGAVVLLTLVLARAVERSGPAELGLRGTRLAWRDLFLGLGLAGALFVSVVGVGAGKGWYSVHPRLDAGDGLRVALAAFLIILPLAALEEVAMRGYLLRALGRSWGRVGGLLGSSAVFALLHSQNPGGAQPLALFGLFLAGLYLGSARLVTGNLWLPIFVHAGWNLMEGPVFGLPVSGAVVPVSILHTGDSGPPLWTGGEFGPEAGLLLGLLLAVHTGVLWALRPVLAPRAAPA